MKPEEIISDSEIDVVHANAQFGDMSKRQVVNLGVLKCVCGFQQGHTSKQISTEHGLITADYKITKKGQRYLWAVYGSEGF